ncbi:hypothetical protein [Arenibaculum pallidiluteum]|uniref:hypothetical protein n=1 Tax=Arenibaculum pallidiluteum TaxID=2812559 RepID=UPI001A96CF35|nr:hypothetical protein [Arenibaculum pallidiluteum]
MDELRHAPQAPEGQRVRIRRRAGTLSRATLAVLLIGGTIALAIVLHLNGTLRDFLDRQSKIGMIMVVLVLNAIGFGYVYLASAVWKQVRREIWRHRDEG